MRLIFIFSLVFVFFTVSGKVSAGNSNASTQNTWVQQTPNISESSLTFLQAVKLGKRDIVAKKLKRGIDVDDRQDGHYPPLFFASAKGYDDIAQMLIQYGANPNIAGRGGWTPLMVAAMHQQDRNITLLLDAGANLELQNGQGKTALMIAIEFDKIDTVNHLVQRGANVNARSQNVPSKGKSVLSLAVEKGNVDVVKMLLAAGAYFNNKIFNSEGPFAVAIEAGQRDMVALLLKLGPNIQKSPHQLDGNNSKRNSCLHHAAEYGTVEILQLLLASGEDPKLKNSTGNTALMVAARAGNIDNVEALASYATKIEIQEVFYIVITTGLTAGVNKILALGASVNAINALGETPLMLAVANRHHLIVDILLAEGANLQAVSNDGRDALMIALTTEPSKQRIVTTLIERGANVQRKNSLGNTALHIAAKHCAQLDFSVVEALLSAGAKQKDANAKGKRAGDLVADSCLQDYKVWAKVR
ncbi:hypothetical protein A9Q81_23250 [Gammaproteobacteria bacterium 42_54_T18]|nr:hypothetical protein A9Q81_23250 [Gammaproteobacteria bacterium 42_54_T18]